MGTACELRLYAESPHGAELAIGTATDEVRRLEQKYSRYREDSFLSTINAIAATSGNIRLDEETAGLLDYAYACPHQSNGLFDITSGILRRAWNFSEPRVPDQAEIKRLLPRVGLDKLGWSQPYLTIPVAGMEIDLGGIVKEYAADCVAQRFMQCGIRSGVIDLGGDIRVLGPQPDGSPWEIGIRDPRAPNTTMRTVAMTQGALASSGDYERFFEIDGIRYGHILNPLTGWPVRGLVQVSIIAETCLVAGSICSIAMLKEDTGIEWLDKLPFRYAWVHENGQIGVNL